MQTSIFALGILLAGQLSEAGGGRYGEVQTAPPVNGGVRQVAPIQVEQQPLSGNSTVVPPVNENQLRTAAPPRVEQPARTAPPVGLTKVTTAADLLSNLARPVGNDKLVGLPMSLLNAVQNASSRAEQTQRVRLYWELSEAVTNYNLDSLSELELQSLRNGIAQAGPAWTEAQQAAAMRKRVARSAVELAQLRLQKALGRNGEANLPLPTDLPHCGDYETKYEQIFRDRSLNEAKQLSELLPLRHEQLGQHAVAAVAARDWLMLVSKQRSPQDDGSQLLKAYENLALQRRAFVSTAYDYNANIARYTELAVPQDIGTVRLVSMLIQSELAANADTDGNSVRQTSAEEALPPGGNGIPRQRTFIGGRRNEVRRLPTEGEPRERSILVKPER